MVLYGKKKPNNIQLKLIKISTYILNKYSGMLHVANKTVENGVWCFGLETAVH